MTMDSFDEPSLIRVYEGEPRIIDTIFNVTGLVTNLFNTSNNALFTYVGGLVLFIVLVGKTFLPAIFTIASRFFFLFQNLLYIFWMSTTIRLLILAIVSLYIYFTFLCQFFFQNVYWSLTPAFRFQSKK